MKPKNAFTMATQKPKMLKKDINIICICICVCIIYINNISLSDIYIYILTLAQDIEPNNYTKLHLPVPFLNGIFEFRGQESTSCIPHHA